MRSLRCDDTHLAPQSKLGTGSKEKALEAEGSASHSPFLIL